MAIACFLLVTFFPLPLFRVPLLRRRIADLTSLDALLDVLRDDVDFFRGGIANSSHPVAARRRVGGQFAL